MKLLRTNKGVLGAGFTWSALVVEDSITQSTNRFAVVAGSTQIVTPSFIFTNGDRMITNTPQSGTLIGASFSFSVNAGDSIYFVPESGNWDNLKELYFQNDDFIFDLSDLEGRINYVDVVNLFNCGGVTGDIFVFRFLTKTLDIYNLIEVVGDIMYLSLLTENVRISKCNKLIGNINAFSNVAFSARFDGVVLLKGDLGSLICNYWLDTENCSDITGLGSDILALYTVRISNCTLINALTIDFTNITRSLSATNTQTSGDIANINVSATLDMLGCGGLFGDLASQKDVSSFVRLIGTSVIDFTGSYFEATNIQWYNTVTPVLESALNMLLSAVVSSGKSNVFIAIGGNNPSITDTQALADIATIQGLGGTVIYNS